MKMNIRCYDVEPHRLMLDMKTFLFFLFILALLGSVNTRAAEQLNCKLEQSGKDWNGSCGKYKGKRFLLNIALGESIKTGTWRSGVEALEIWGGQLKYGKSPARTVEIEHYKDDVSIARTSFGWFMVTDWSHTGNNIKFVMHTDVEVVPSKLDLMIVQRAAEILKYEFSWNRKDDRKCPEGATSWSIYCAMEQAIIEVSGSFHHRRPGMQVVRRIIQERSRGRNYKHALMDYNNDKSTSFEDVGSLFKEAQIEIAK
jgi:hypothetical protein